MFSVQLTKGFRLTKAPDINVSRNLFLLNQVHYAVALAWHIAKELCPIRGIQARLRNILFIRIFQRCLLGGTILYLRNKTYVKSHHFSVFFMPTAFNWNLSKRTEALLLKSNHF